MDFSVVNSSSKAILSFFLLFFVTQSKSAEILEFFPNCVEEEIETLKVSTRMRSKNGIVTAQEKDEYSKALLNKLTSLAATKHADAVILLRKNVISPSARSTGKAINPKFTLEYTAQLLRLCEDDRSQSSRTTPFNKEGNTQLSLGMLSIQEKTLTIPTAKRQDNGRTSLNSHNIDFVAGVYGVTLGSNMAQIEKVFGTPQITLKIGENSLIVGYGRSLWLTLLNDELIEVSTRNDLFKQGLLNTIPFNSKFDDADWKLNGLHGKGTLEREIPWSSDKLTAKEQVLEALWDDGRKGDRRLTGFRYYDEKAEHLSVGELVIGDLDYSWLHNALSKSSDEMSQAIESALDKAVGQINEDHNSKIYIFDNHVRIYTINGMVNKIIIGDEQFKNLAYESSSQWKFRGVKYNDTLESIVSTLGKPSVEVNEALIYEYPNYSIKLDFYDYDKDLQLFKIEFYQI